MYSFKQYILRSNYDADALMLYEREFKPSPRSFTYAYVSCTRYVRVELSPSGALHFQV